MKTYVSAITHGSVFSTGRLGAFALMMMFGGFWTVGGLSAGLFPYLVVNYMYSMMAKVAQDVFVTSFLLPLFNIFITLTFAKEFAKYLGSEVDFSAIEKLL